MRLLSRFIIKPEKFLEFGAATTVLLLCLYVSFKNNEYFWQIVGFVYLVFLAVSYVSLQYTRKPFPINHEASLRVHAAENIEWTIRGVDDETVYGGRGSEEYALPKTSTYRSENRKEIVAEFVYLLEVNTPNANVLASLTVETDDEISETVGINGGDEPTLLYTSIPIGYGTRHWIVPPFLQGYPKAG